MLASLSKDLQRYCESSGHNNAGFFERVRVIAISPAYWAIVHFRFGHWVNTFFGTGYRNPLKIFFKALYFLSKQVVVWLIKIDILVTSDIGPGLFLSNKGGIIFGGEHIGSCCTVHHNVTVGRGVEKIVPRLGDNVWIGHDSVVYGDISIGSNTIIESGTILAKSLPGNMIVGGNPCRIRRRDLRPGPYSIYSPEDED